MGLVLGRNIFDRKTIETLRSRADQVLDEIKQEYFSGKSIDEFLSCHSGHTSLVMKIAAYRFMSSEIADVLKSGVSKLAEEIYGEKDLLFHPLFSLRYTFPDVVYSDQHAAAFLDSQPHYDRSFGVDAYTFWVALVDIDEESGGLAEFSGTEVELHFRTNGLNKYNYDGYLNAAPQIDPMLRKSIWAPSVNAGDVLTFDSKTLHGATKATKRKRVSLDFRLAPKRNIANSPNDVKGTFQAVQKSLDYCNGKNLEVLGETIGASKMLRRLGNAPTLDAPSLKITEPYSQHRWQDEYSFLREGRLVEEDVKVG